MRAQLNTRNYEIGRNQFIKWSIRREGELILFDKLGGRDRSRKRNLEFHVKSGDYFGTLATILDLLRQEQKKSIKSVNLLGRLRDDLMHLQKNYKIKEKKKRNNF